MDRSSRPPAPKDDDSWGKLASDLFGIDLGPQDDFDFAEAEKPAAPPATSLGTASSPVVDAASSEVPLSEGFADDGEDDDTQVEDAAEEAVEVERDDYWDALETWDWNEGERAREKRAEGGQSAERTTRDDDRGRRGGGRSPRGRGSRDDAPRGDRQRPPRGESRRADTEAPKSESSGETKPAAPRRESGEPRSAEKRSQADRPRRPAKPETADAGAKSAAKPPRPRPPVKRKPISDDDFGAGLDEDLEQDDVTLEAEPDNFPPAINPPHERLDDDDFAAGLDEDRGEVGEQEDHEEGEERGRPKRRRRRRRRGRGAGETTETSAVGEESVGSSDLDEDDVEERASDDDLSTEERSVEEGEAGDEDRPRRRRRRRRRRPTSTEGAPARSQSEDADSEDEDDRDHLDAPTVIEQAGHLDEVFDDEEREPIQRVSYDDVPTWDEAISYLVKMPAGGDSRGRGGRDQGHNRGRRPPSRRPRNDGPTN